MQIPAYDVVIVGGGIAGLTLALALLKKTSLSIALLETKKPSYPWSLSQYQHRVSAISLASQRIFQHLSCFLDMQAMRVSPFMHMHVWDEQSQGEIFFDSNIVSEPELGFIIENHVIQQSVYNHIKHCSQINIITECQLTMINVKEDAVYLTLKTGEHITAKLLVAADGTHSFVRDQVGIACDQVDYEQLAIVATVQTELPHEKTARQVFLADGVLAFLPLKDEHLSSFVWSLPAHAAKTWLACDESTFKQALAKNFSYRLGHIQDMSLRYSFPLQQLNAKQYVKGRVVLIGDAAHTIHPLAGQGVNMGLLDVASLTDVILADIQKGNLFPSVSSLRYYERWRKADHLALMTVVHEIRHLFSHHQKTTRMLSSFGLNLINHTPSLKAMLINHALGNRSGLPTMVTGFQNV